MLVAHLKHRRSVRVITKSSAYVEFVYFSLYLRLTDEDFQRDEKLKGSESVVVHNLKSTYYWSSLSTLCACSMCNGVSMKIFFFCYSWIVHTVTTWDTHLYSETRKNSNGE